MLEYNKNYVTLAFSYTLKNLKEIVSASEIDKRSRKNNISKRIYE